MNFSVDNPGCEVWSDRGEYMPMKAGAHLMQITHVELGHSKKHNCPMLVIRFTDIREGADEGKSCRQFFVVIKESWGIGKLVPLCIALGIRGISGDPENGIDPVDEQNSIDSLLGKVVVCELSIRKFKGDSGDDMKGNDVKSYRAPKPGALDELMAANGGEMPPLPDDSLKSWDGSRRLGSGAGAVSDDDDGGYDNDFDESDLPF